MVHAKVDWSCSTGAGAGIARGGSGTPVVILAGSSNGRTAAFGAASGGSNPPPAAAYSTEQTGVGSKCTTDKHSQ